jgi:DNA topoisomerase-1
MVNKKVVEDPVKEYGEKEIKDNLIPMDEGDVAHAVDVPVKDMSESVEIIEKVGENVKSKVKKPVRKKRAKKKSVRKSNSWVDNFRIPGNKKLKERGPIMIITEKPQSSLKIANALAEGKVEITSVKGVSYYEFMRGGKAIVVVNAVGHLFSLAQVKARNPWPNFDIKWAPSYLLGKSDFTKKYYDVIAKIAKRASEIVVATDYDIEGEVIGMNIVRYICNQEDAERMKFSTLTSKEIQDSFDNRSKTLDWKQGIAGETRHYLDWIYGINLSRALMDALRTTGKFRLMSIGRVQGPALHIIVDKEKEIQNFVSEKYWQIFADVSDGKNKVEVKHVRDIKLEEELDDFRKLEGKEGNAETKKSQQNLQPPAPFDLTSLQIESYKFFKLTPAKTLQIAQSLYLHGVISYPRTSSQKIPREIGYDKILNRLKDRFGFVSLVSRREPIEGKKVDPAHPSIFPTGEFHPLGGNDRKVYELIVKRFVSCFCDDAVIDDKKISVDIEGKRFSAKGLGIRTRGWMDVYPSVLKENEIPDLNGRVDVLKIKIEEKMTQPPKRYTPASIVSELEKRNLGTKATRASIVETLYDRGYVSGKSIQATSLGISLIDTLEDNCDIIIDEKLTKDIENSLDKLRESANPKAKEEEILEENKKVIFKIGEKFSKNKEKIGKDLVESMGELLKAEKEERKIMPCKVCNKGMLGIRYGKKYKSYFVGCDAFPECSNTYGLPKSSLIKTSDKVCEHCNWKMLVSIKRGKRPWVFCFNPECPSKESN